MFLFICCRLNHLQLIIRGESDKPIFGPKVDGILQVGCEAKDALAHEGSEKKTSFARRIRKSKCTLA